MKTQSRTGRNSGLNTRGFTLVEIVIALAILGTLASIATTTYRGFQVKARQSEALLGLAGLYTAQTSHAAEAESFSACLADIGFLLDAGNRYFRIGFSVAAAGSRGCGIHGMAPCNINGYMNSGGERPCTVAPGMDPGNPYAYPATATMRIVPPSDNDMDAARISKTSFVGVAAGPTAGNYATESPGLLISSAMAADCPPGLSKPVATPSTTTASTALYDAFTIDETKRISMVAAGVAATPEPCTIPGKGRAK